MSPPTRTTEPLEFAGSRGKRLSGVLDHPANGSAARGSILLSHCFTCSKDLHTMSRLARGLAEAGYAVLRFDFTGLGASGGEFRESTVSTQVGDVTRAAATLIERGYGPCGAIGHSLGGTATLLAAAKLKTVRSLAVVGAPATPRQVRRLFRGSEPVILEEGEACVAIAGRRFPISRSFLEDLERHDAEGSVAALARPLLILHSVTDEVVPVNEGERIFAAARQPKAFVPLLESDHLLSKPEWAEHALATLRAWFARTL